MKDTVDVVPVPPVPVPPVPVPPVPPPYTVEIENVSLSDSDGWAAGSTGDALAPPVTTVVMGCMAAEAGVNTMVVVNAVVAALVPGLVANEMYRAVSRMYSVSTGCCDAYASHSLLSAASHACGGGMTAGHVPPAGAGG